MTIVYWLAAMIVLAEALNKLERTDVRRAGLTAKQRSVTVLKAAGWTMLAIGAGGVVIGPMLHEIPTWMDSLQRDCVMAGFAVLILRSRLREGSGVQPVQPEDFDRTMVVSNKDLQHARVLDVDREAEHTARSCGSRT